MATKKHITELFEKRIRHDSPGQFDKAGAKWAKRSFDFFYLTNAEDTVDIVVRSITEKVADEDDIKIPGFILSNLAKMVGPKTAVEEAVVQVFLTTFQPKPK